MEKNWKFGNNIVDKNYYYHKSGKIVLKPHSYVTTHIGQLKEPVFGGYSIEIETPYDIKTVKFYLSDTTKSYPNFINNHESYKNISEVRKAMVSWAKRNSKQVNKMVKEW